MKDTLRADVRPRESWGWVMYGFANSGFTTVVITALSNAYFVAVVAGNAPWAYPRLPRNGGWRKALCPTRLFPEAAAWRRACQAGHLLAAVETMPGLLCFDSAYTNDMC